MDSLCPVFPTAGSLNFGFSAAAESAKGAQRADVRGPAGDYRDPAGAIQQHNFEATVKDATRALPNNTTTADQSAAVRSLAGDSMVYGNPLFRNPAGVIQQDKATGGL
jgi:hypothetical protein